MEWYRSFNQKYSVVGNLMLISGGCYLLGIVLLLVLGETRFNLVFAEATLPMDLSKAVQQPWSIFTFWAVNHPITLWMALVDVALMFSFGMLLQTMVGRERFKWLVLAYISAIALLTLFFAQFLPTLADTKNAPLFGMHGLNAAIIMTCVMLAPRLRMRLYIWEVELVWIGLVALLMSLVGYRAIFTVIGTSILIAILTGGAVGFFLRRQNLRALPPFARQNYQQQSMALDRVRVREVRPNPQHKGKFTVVGGPANLAPEDELDKLLDRINEVGYEGLTASEKKRLEELSQ
jgi:membrane associated rhomboid family serine protease